MFKFEDIADLPNRVLQLILTRIDIEELPYALTNASDKIKKAILNSMSKRAAEYILEELENIKKEITEENITVSRDNIISVIKELVQTGEVDLPEYEDNYYDIEQRAYENNYLVGDDYFKNESISYMDAGEEDEDYDQSSLHQEKVNFRFEDIVYLDKEFLVKYLNNIIYYSYNQKELALALIESTPQFRDTIYSYLSSNNRSEINLLIYNYTKQLQAFDQNQKAKKITDAKEYLVQLIDEIDCDNMVLTNKLSVSSYPKKCIYCYATTRKFKKIHIVCLNFCLASLVLLAVKHGSFQLDLISLVISFVFFAGVFVVRANHRNQTIKY